MCAENAALFSAAAAVVVAAAMNSWLSGHILKSNQ